MLDMLMAFSLLATPASALPGCGSCAPGSPEFNAFWCGGKTNPDDCSAPDIVDCKWLADQCVPAE